MGNEWTISIWVSEGEGQGKFYYNKQIMSGDGGWDEMQAALVQAREYGRPITLAWRGDTLE